MRIKKHPILSFQAKEIIDFVYNGQQVHGLAGDTIASALHALGIKELSKSSKSKRSRGFCASATAVPARWRWTAFQCQSLHHQAEQGWSSPLMKGLVFLNDWTRPISVGLRSLGSQSHLEAGLRVTILNVVSLLAGNLSNRRTSFRFKRAICQTRGIDIAEKMYQNLLFYQNLLKSRSDGSCHLQRLCGDRSQRRQIFEIQGQSGCRCWASEKMLGFVNNDFQAFMVQALSDAYESLWCPPGKGSSWSVVATSA